MARRGRFPWVLVAASVILAALLAYTLFWGLVPARQRIASLELELKTLYAREAALQTRLTQLEQRGPGRDPTLAALIAERDMLRGRLADLERQLGVARGRR
jgi:type II secretory pathway component PulM